MPIPTSVPSSNLRLTSSVTRSLLMVRTWTLTRPEPSLSGKKLFATLVLPLSSLVKKDVVGVWDERQRQDFNVIKLGFLHTLVLRLSDFGKLFVVTIDVNRACIGGFLSQLHNGNDLPVAFFSKKLRPHELNHKKETYAINRHSPVSVITSMESRYDVYTDNSACKCFFFRIHACVVALLAGWTFRVFSVHAASSPRSTERCCRCVITPPEDASILKKETEYSEFEA
ncbi:polyprotein [Phytophthora megakarya]|uniref:Polyprotein n=1 Tax=Phytophthora megakarya TaxID=4795 RepID=A0A225WJQ9_9STRA|nr:polyprotein [Phytophthora megakarya]